MLIISGLFDCFTPAMASFEMKRRLPNARHYCDPFSSHATLLENPIVALDEIDSFILDFVRKFRRKSSNDFVQDPPTPRSPKCGVSAARAGVLSSEKHADTEAQRFWFGFGRFNRTPAVSGLWHKKGK